MKLPAAMLRDELIVEPLVAETGRGPRYGPARRVRCYTERAKRTVRDGQGRDHDTATAAYCQLADADVLTLDARATYDGDTVEIVDVKRRELRGGPTPNHVEVIFV